MTKKNGGSPQGRDRSGQQGGPGLSLTPVSALLLAAAATALAVLLIRAVMRIRGRGGDRGGGAAADQRR